jgi:uncharacterized repeat protein (TIGR02543 family)
MKKIIISFVAFTFLIMCGFSQNYEYTDTKFVQYFDGSQVDKTGVFSWTHSAGGNFSINEGVLTITKAFQKWGSAKLAFDSTTLDLSELPYVTFEAKADVDSLLVIQLKDGSGNFTSGQHKTYFSTEWETYSFRFVPGIWGSTDITDIKSVEFYRLDKASINGNLYLKYIALGDTSVAFGPTQFNLNANATAGGSVSLDPAGGKYDSSTVVTAVATPDSGYSFVSWTGDVSSTNDSIQITMDANKSVTANFTLGVEQSISNEQLDAIVKLYPNPANETVYISGIDGISSAKVSDLTGKTLINIRDENIQQINISGLKPGMYVVTCNTEKGTLNKLFVKK